MRRFPRFRPLLLSSVFGFYAALPGYGFPQSPAAEAPIPFEEWVAEGNREEVPWKVRVGSPWLRPDQRLSLRIRVSLSGDTLNRRGPVHNLTVIARMADPSGRWISNTARLSHAWDKPLPRRSQADVFLEFLVLPGRYQVVVLLYDRVTGDRNVFRRSVSVSPISKDPLPEAFRNLPRAEFVRGPTAEGGSPGALRSRLWLPVDTRRPVEIEVIVNLSVSEPSQGRRWLEMANLSLGVSAMQVLSQLSVSNGTLNLTAVDVIRRRVVFEQRSAAGLDWQRLDDALKGFNPGVISVRALEDRERNAAFFREVVEERLARSQQLSGRSMPSTGAAPPAPSPRQRPVRVLIIVSNSSLFPRRSDLTPLTPRENEDLRVFYLHYRLTYGDLWDDISKLIRPLKPQKFDVTSPLAFREALGKILADLRKL